MMLLLLMLFAFSTILTTGAVQSLSFYDTGQTHPPDAVELEAYYGTLASSMYSLYLSITGGISWGELVTPLSDVGSGYIALFLVFEFFSFFAVLNVVTGVFVDTALQSSKNEAEAAVEREMEKQREYSTYLWSVLSKIDKDRSGGISGSELEDCLDHPEITACLGVLQIQHDELRRLFLLLDIANNDEVLIDDLVSGCARLKGGAKSIDVATIMSDTCKIMLAQEEHARSLEEVKRLLQGTAPPGRAACRGYPSESLIDRRLHSSLLLSSGHLWNEP